MKTTVNSFERFWSLGFKRLVPIIPPGAQISEKSTLYKRVDTHQDGRGKTPGVKYNGLWSSFDWTPCEADTTDIQRWNGMGAGVGIKTGSGLIAIDADTIDDACAEIIRDTIDATLGRLPIRVGRYPKALYLCRVDGLFQYSRVEFGERDDKGRLLDRVEVLSDGRQFVAHGIHPKTSKPYTWPREILPFDELPTFKPQQITDLLHALRQALPAASPLIKEGGTQDVNQQALRGRLEHVGKAVTAIPNTSALFPSREAYRDMGYAIKAALPDDEAAAFELFSEWCERWDGGTNEPDIVEADWRRMKPPFRRGAGWLYELAERHGGDSFSPADIWFEDVSAPDNPFAEIELNRVAETAPLNIRATTYDFPDPAAIPRRQLLYGSHYVRQFVSTTAAPTKVGKTSLLIVEALAMASGKPLLGVKVAKPLRVWLWNGEDPLDELRRRIAAAMLHYGLTKADLMDTDGSSRLYVDSGRDMEIVLATSGRDGTKIAEPVESAVMATIRAERLDVLSIDPFVSSHRVPENDNGGIDMVAKRWARIADRTNTAVELVHHVRKLNGGEVTIEDARGASALISAARSARALARMTKGEGIKMGLEPGSSRRLFRFADAQSNLALPAAAEEVWMELRSVSLGNGGDDTPRGDSVGVTTIWEGAGINEIGADGTAAEAIRAHLLDIVRAGTWRKDPRAGDAWAGNAVAQAHRLDTSDPADKARARAILGDLIRTGVLVEVNRQDPQRHVRSYIEVQNTDKSSEDIFS